MLYCIHRATRDTATRGCQLNVLAKTDTALCVRAKRLYDEGKGAK